MNKIHFSKMHGAGNDYIYVNTMLYPIANPERAAIVWSNRHKGIGSDGLVLIGKANIPNADFSMRIFNADGSEAMMCGNATRCIGKYLYEKQLTELTTIRLQTLAGIKTIKLHLKDGIVTSATVDMGEPALLVPEQCTINQAAVPFSLTADNRRFEGLFVSMGNPHFVTFVSETEQAEIARYGSLLERNEAFPGRCNIEFALTDGKGNIRTRVWERGSGITQACGTGACATAVAASLSGRCGRQSRIVMDGGALEIDWNENDNHVYMTGPAEFSFEGEVAVPENQ